MASLAEKLAAKAAEVASAPGKANRVTLELDSDNERLEWSCDITTFLDAVKPSASGESEGLMVTLSGKFKYTAPDGSTYTFDLGHARGGGAWVIVRMVGMEAAKAPVPISIPAPSAAVITAS